MTKTSPIKGLDELEVITLFVEDVAACKKFYLDVFGMAPRRRYNSPVRWPTPTHDLGRSAGVPC
jgi:catechol 2,3-dioxygenase-like lactoylglutathione lyase family enzyme